MGLRNPRPYRFEGEVLRIAPEGRVSAEQYVAWVEGALADPACPPRVALLSDTSRATGDRTTAEIRWIARSLRDRADRIGRIALLAPSDLRYGMSRLAATYVSMEGFEAEAFRDEAEALAWLTRPA